MSMDTQSKILAACCRIANSCTWAAYTKLQVDVRIIRGHERGSQTVGAEEGKFRDDLFYRLKRHYR